MLFNILRSYKMDVIDELEEELGNRMAKRKQEMHLHPLSVGR